ncbi:MAG: respiratory nitrate reductase subunit gamma [Chromatiales bacterium]|nr:respiratory nitrate reductase subunit gamma [Chromatiales bacterium]
MNEPMEFLLWVRGPAFDIAALIFIVGIILRLFEIFSLGRKPNFSEPRGTEFGPGMKTIMNRSFPESGTFKRQPLTVIVGYVFHIGLLISLVLFVPHIELFRETFGFGWPGLPNPIVDAAAVISIVALLAALWHRITNPVMRVLTNHEDWLVWALTFLPMLTGYLAYHRMIEPYPLVLGLHILSVEALMVFFPFTKLMHAFTLFIARWYNGAMNGRRGVES